jgi:endonuclease YncB( thermonuclease family)
MYKILLSFAFLLLSVVSFGPSYGACPCAYTPALLIEVIDGDTIWFLVKGEEIRVQVADIHTPELSPTSENANWCEEEGRKAILARDFVSQHLNSAKEILLDVQEITPNGDNVAVVYIDGVNLGQELLYQYLAIENTSNTPLWCK